MIAYLELISSIVLLAALAGFATCDEITNFEFGFRATVPDEFFEFESELMDEDGIALFVNREPTPENAAITILFQRLRGVVSVDSQLKKSDVPDVEGIETVVGTIRWRNHVLSTLRNRTKSPSGQELIFEGVQFPLAGEAVQLYVFGPMEEEHKVKEIFLKVTSGFVNLKPLHQSSKDYGLKSNAGSYKKLSTSERIQKLASAIVRFAIIAIIGVLIFKVIKGTFGGRD